MRAVGSEGTREGAGLEVDRSACSILERPRRWRPTRSPRWRSAGGAIAGPGGRLTGNVAILLRSDRCTRTRVAWGSFASTGSRGRAIAAALGARMMRCDALAASQCSEPSEPMITGLAHTGVCVPDLAKAVQWYTQTLGLVLLSPPARIEGPAIEKDMAEMIPGVVLQAAILGARDSGDRDRKSVVEGKRG